MSHFLISSYGLERKTKAELLAHWQAMSGQVPDPKWTKAELAEGIRGMVEKSREQRYQDASAQKTPKSQCQIPASEVNEWLKTLPRKECV